MLQRTSDGESLNVNDPLVPGKLLNYITRTGERRERKLLVIVKGEDREKDLAITLIKLGLYSSTVVTCCHSPSTASFHNVTLFNPSATANMFPVSDHETLQTGV